MRVILVSKNFSANRHISHIGLGVAGINTAKTLQAHGICSEVWQVIDSNELRMRLNLARRDDTPITHVIISAPWIVTTSLNHLCTLFPSISFAMNCHSNVGFLQADTNGMRLIREALELEMAVANFKVSANSQKMATWVRSAYGSPCVYLPNLYYIHKHHGRTHVRERCGNLRIGVFGATRPQKNIMSSVGAAIEIAYQTKSATEIWLSSGRTEGGGDVILRSIKEMVKGLPNISLHHAGWQTWPQFRRLVGSMHLLLQPSYTESFNMVVADGIVEGVPSVVAEAIDWVPKYWIANADDVCEIARIGKHLLNYPCSAQDGLEHLQNYVEHGLRAWHHYLRE